LVLKCFADWPGFSSAQAKTLSQGNLLPYLLKRPISIILIVLTVLSVGTTVHLNLRRDGKFNEEVK